MHALIIEDEVLVALSIEDSLESLGFVSSQTVATEETAVTAACLHLPDLITADVRLAKGSGITAVRTILRDQQVPVVFITGNVEMVREQMHDAVVLQKPYHEKALRDAIAAARRRITADSATDPTASGPSLVQGRELFPQP
jgi:CheY-like chemotaxis protein